MQTSAAGRSIVSLSCKYMTVTCNLQQIDNVAVETENARRYFVGVAGDKKLKGELFGIQNMFTLRIGDKCLTEDILKVKKHRIHIKTKTNSFINCQYFSRSQNMIDTGLYVALRIQSPNYLV